MESRENEGPGLCVRVGEDSRSFVSEAISDIVSFFWSAANEPLIDEMDFMEGRKESQNDNMPGISIDLFNDGHLEIGMNVSSGFKDAI
jgi:hypothetical protein